MKKQIIAITSILMFLFLIGNVFAGMTREKGDISLTWHNPPNFPQQFTGTIDGGLTGDITIIIQTDTYDPIDNQTGVIYAEIFATIDGEPCEGFYFASNAKTQSGTLTLQCGDETMIQGGMIGVKGTNDMFLQYDVFKINPILGATGPQGPIGPQGIQGEIGPKGDKGDVGTQGERGEQGIPGINGIDGKDGINGIDGLNGKDGTDGKDGLPGVQGQKGDKGDKGEKGEKGEQGIPGATQDLTPINNRLTYLESVITSLSKYFPDFWNYFNSPQECINGQFMCSGNNLMKCIDYRWSNQQNCQYGCSNSQCNPQPPSEKEDCTLKSKTYSCVNLNKKIYSRTVSYNGCQAGEGTSTSCNLGKCIEKNQDLRCWGGCNQQTGRCL